MKETIVLVLLFIVLCSAAFDEVVVNIRGGIFSIHSSTILYHPYTPSYPFLLRTILFLLSFFLLYQLLNRE